MNFECEESFTPRDVYSSILQAHRVYKIVNLLQVNLTIETLSEPMSTRIRKTMNQMQARIKLLEHQYRKTDQFSIEKYFIV